MHAIIMSDMVGKQNRLRMV